MTQAADNPNPELELDDNLTEDERAALDEAQAEDDAAAAADTEVPQDAPAAATPQDPPTPSAEDRLGAAADKLATVADRLATSATPAEPSTPEPTPEPERDFKSELDALKDKYDDGDLDQDEYLEARDAIKDAERDARLDARLAEEREQAARAAAEAAQAADDARWHAERDQFFADPANAALVDDPIKAGAFQAAINEAGKEVTAGDYAALLAKARELVGGAPAPVAKDKVRAATFERQKQTPDAPTTLRDTPNASDHETPGTALDNLEIDQLEDHVAAMKPDALERYLAGAPGGLSDNPRRAD